MVTLRNYIVATSVALGLCFALTPPVWAGTLQSVADITLYAAQSTEKNDGTIAVSFTALNNDATAASFQYGLRIQDATGALVYEEVFDEEATLLPHERTTTQLQTTKTIAATDPYEVFVVAKSSYGIILALAGAGTIAPTVTPNTPPVHFKRCTWSDADQQIDCVLQSVPTENELASYVLTYDIYRGSIYGEHRATRQQSLVDIQDDTLHLALLDMPTDPGKYEIRLTLSNVDTPNIIIDQENVMAVVSGSWIALDEARAQRVNDIAMDIVLRFDGSEHGNDRGFLYWLLDDDATVCADGLVTLNNINPKQRQFSELIPPQCSTPHFAGVLYNGRDADGNVIIVTTVGDADFDTLLKQLSLKTAVQSFLQSPYTRNIAFVSLLFVIVALLGVVVLRRRARNAEPQVPTGMVGVLIFTALFGLGTHVVSAATFLSVDKNGVQFSVNLDEPSYMTEETIGFSLAFVDVDTGLKPSGGSIDVSVDGGATTTVVETTDTGIFYTSSVPGLATEGTHTLTFSSPNLCGGFFDISLFHFARWDVYDCEFEIDVIVDNTPDAPYPPSITSEEVCATGTPFEMAVRSVHPLGLDVYYNIDWDADYTIDERVPASGYVGHDIPMSITHTWTDNVNVRAQAVDDVAAESTWNTYFAVCGPTVGGDVTLNLTATPKLVQPNGEATVAWSTSDAYDCVVTGTNGASWAGASGSQVVTNINEEIIFTLTCDDFYGTATSTSAKVLPRPDWHEF